MTMQMDHKVICRIARAAGLSVQENKPGQPLARLDDRTQRWLYSIPAPDFEHIVRAVAEEALKAATECFDDDHAGAHAMTNRAARGCVERAMRDRFGVFPDGERPR